eukprot:CAMPEP_0197624080 /NCGR_PEP_ID=MMETSP1338-20131121/3872_1 /TAXON_ID=43686 ORGANISM="Pelagodinium beii, Strain RCC1491" /NCGR_SAMPLE_ID=MMETSP1338 /ASSEMBLY_ACC=CAM_ASM_000754 /LENGTH=858 /DNA_ID=CAMNT_0043194177 /DNA_START=178 /DNA_END=2754 /DNA_ORIENTATION=-
MRTFNSGSDDPQKLGSPQERVLSPLHDQALGAGTGAGEEEITGELSDMSGEVTANVPDLSNLVHQDELDPKAPVPKAAANPGATADKETPVRTPTTDVETSPLREYDLYQQFKGSQASQESAPGPSKAPTKYAARSPPPSMRRGLSPDTVDMGGVVEKIHEYGKGRSSSRDEEPEVPEGRKSFMSTYLEEREGSKSASSQNAAVEKVPTPLRGKREGPYGMYKKDWKTQGRVPSTSPPPSAGIRAGKSPPVAREVRSQNIVDFKSSGKRGELAAAALQSPPPTNRRGPVQKAGQERERRSTQVSSVGGEGDSLSYSPTGESALPGSSALQAIPSGPAGLPASGRRLAWDEFLSHCGIAFPPMEHQPAVGSMEVEFPAAPLVDGCPRTQNAANVFSKNRAQCLQQVVKELVRRNEKVQRQYNTNVQQWNGAANQPPSASELLEVLDKPQDLELFRNRIKSWQAHCKNEAWLSWYEAKHDYLSKDLQAARAQTMALRTELQAVKDACNRLGEASKTAKAMSKQEHHRQTLQETAKRMTDMADEAMHDAEEDRQLMLRKAPEAQEALEQEQQQLADLEQRVEEASNAAQQSRNDLHQAKRSLLSTKARRVELQQQRYARTCMVTKATATRLDLSLRAGACATVAMAGAASLARISFQPPRRSTGDTLDLLAQELFQMAWRKIMSSSGDQVQSSAYEVTVPSADVPSLIRQLDCAALRVEDQLEALKLLRKNCAEVTDVSAKLCEADGDSPWLAVAISFITSRSHRVAAGPGGLTPLHSAAVAAMFQTDATKCIIEFSSNLVDFPDFVNWADASVRHVFGRSRGAQDAVREALDELGQGASLSQAAVAAAQAMNLSAGPSER